MKFQVVVLFVAAALLCATPSLSASADGGEGDDAVFPFDTLSRSDVSPTVSDLEAGSFDLDQGSASDEEAASDNELETYEDVDSGNEASDLLSVGFATARTHHTCAEIKLDKPSSPSGTYSITVNGKPFSSYCDMDTDGGGWTLFTTIDQTMQSGQWAPFTKPDVFGLTSMKGNQLGSKPANTDQRIRVDGTDWHVDMKTKSPTPQWRLDPCVEHSDISNVLISQKGFSNGLPTGIRVHNNKGSGCNGIGHVYMTGGCSSPCHGKADCKKCDNGETRLTIKNITPNGQGYYYLATFGGYHGWTAAPRSSLGGYQTQCPPSNNENLNSHYRCQGFIDQVNWKLISMWHRSADFSSKIAAAQAADASSRKLQHVKAALDAHSGDHKALFSTLMQHIKSRLETMKSSTVSQLEAVTIKRDAAKRILDAAIKSKDESEKSFSDAVDAKQAVDRGCKKAQDAAVATQAALSFATSSFNARNPIAEKELAVIRSIVDKVGDLKSINLEETHDMIDSLQTFEAEAESLSEMIDLAREHAEFTKPILDLLKQLQTKLLAEIDSLTAARTNAKNAHTAALSASESACGKVEAKRLEMTSAQTQLNSATSARNAAQQEYDSLQKLWTSTHAASESSLESYTAEMRSLNRLQTCSLAPAKPFSSCYEILADNPKARSGLHTIEIDSKKQQVYCDMESNGGGWTLLLSQDAKGGYFQQANALMHGLLDASGPPALYSILGEVKSFKRDGKFEFRYNTLASKGKNVNTWVTASQTSNPLDSSRAGGCAADWKVLSSNYDVGASAKLFCGWTPGPSGWAVINGYGPNWTHAVGQYKVYSDWPLVCTYNTHYFCSKVQFWVR